MKRVPDDGLQSGLAAVQSAVEDGVVGFLQVDRRDTPSRRYLTRCLGPDRETAVVVLPATADRPAQAIYCVPTDSTAAVESFADVEDGLDRRVVGRPPSTATGQHVCEILANRLGEGAGRGRLLVPRDLPHDTAVFLQQAGYELQSTAVVRTARATKTPSERDCLTAVQQAAVGGMAHAEAVLASSATTDDGLTVEGRALSAERLRRAINAELTAHGVSPAANTRIETTTGTEADGLLIGEPICIQLAPQGPNGYHGQLTRTLAVDSEGGWERRAHVAVEAGLRAAARHIKPGVDISTVEGETVAEIGAYGFPVGQSADDDTETRTTATVHGVGLSTYERPTPESERTLQEGMVVAVEAGVVDPTHGAIRLSTLRAVTEEGSRRLVPSASSLTPTDRRADSDSSDG